MTRKLYVRTRHALLPSDAEQDSSQTEGKLGPWSLSPGGQGPESSTPCGWYSLALGLRIGLGGCVEASKLCPVIRRNYKQRIRRYEREKVAVCGLDSRIPELT